MNLHEQWNNLSLREKQTVLIGGAAVALFLLYEIIWSPLANKVDTLRGQVQHNSALLAWMKNTDTQLATLNKTTERKTLASASILGVMQDQIKKSPFAAHVTQLKQAENNAVQITLSKVSFDALTKWLTQLWKESGLAVAQMTVTPTGTAGEVNVDVVLKTI